MEDTESFSRYLKDVCHYSRISLVREKVLSDIINDNKSSKESKSKAKKELMEGNLRLVVKVAVKYFKKISNLDDVNLSLMDLIQYGNIGLSKAAEKYKWSSKTRFGTYAYVSIERNIMSAIKDSRMIRIPHQYFKHMKEMDNCTDINDSISDKDLAKKMKVTEKVLNSVKNSRYSKISIEKIAGLIEKMESKDPLVSEILSKKEEIQFMYKMINELSPRHKKVLYYRYLNNKEMSLSDVGKKLGITREAVRNIEIKAIIKLRRKVKIKT